MSNDEYGFDDDGLGVPKPDKLYGIYEGFVTDNEDPEGLYRIRFRIPGLFEASIEDDDKDPDMDEHGEDDPKKSSPWARITGSKIWGVPEIDEPVDIMFVNGDPRVPKWMWSSPRPVDVPDEAEGGDPNMLIISTPSFVIQLDDREGSEGVRILEPESGQGILLEKHSHVIRIKSVTGTVIHTEGSIVIEGMGGCRVQGRRIDDGTPGGIK